MEADYLEYLDGNEEDLLLLMMADETEEEKWRQIIFNLDDYSDNECKKIFRFAKNDIPGLLTALEIPQQIKCSNKSSIDGMTALLMVLRRLSYPNRLVDLQRMFGRSESELSLFINSTINHIYNRFHHLVTDMNQPWLHPIHLEQYAQAIGRLCPLQHLFGFIDGTVRPICRPGENQRDTFSGHKRVHGVKFQSVMLPNGIVANMFGPIEGRRHDCFMLRESGVLHAIENFPLASNGFSYGLYGDPAYPLRPQLLAPFKDAQLTDDQKNFNKEMSSVRECVEWGFGKILNNWAFLDYKKNLKILLQPVAKYYIVGTILTNCHTCLYGSQTSSLFNLDPPSLEDYLR